jgi:hypothetical protein
LNDEADRNCLLEWFDEVSDSDNSILSDSDDNEDTNVTYKIPEAES